MTDIYLQFLAHLDTLTIKEKIRNIDPVSIRLLEEITVKHYENSSMTVGQSMALKQIASPATIHRKIEKLKSLGYIELECMNNDNRTKYVIPTSITHAYYEKLSNVMAVYLKSNYSKSS